MSNNEKGGFSQNLRKMVGEEIKAALENAVISEEENVEEVNIREADEKAVIEKMIRQKLENAQTLESYGMMGEADAERAAADELKAKLKSLGESNTGTGTASLEEKVKAAIRSALLEEDEDKDDDELESTEKHDDDPALKGDQDELPDELQAAIIDKAEDEDDEECEDDEDEDKEDDDDDDEEKNESLHERIKKSILRALNENNNPGTAFAPNHYCIHHGGVQHEGKIVAAEAISHNYNEELGRVTHYNMRLEDGTVLENIASEDIQVTNASLAEGHKHNMNRDKDEEEVEEGYKSYNRDKDEDDDDFVYATDPKTAETDKNAADARRAYKPAGKPKESLSRLAEAGNRELNIRHRKLFEKLTKKWTK